MFTQNASQKTNTILRWVFFIFLLILFRVWLLTILQKETWEKEAQKPQRRTILVQATRGTIRDRFLTPLAINKIRYDASIYYSHIKQIPALAWKLENGKKISYSPRKDYISRLSIASGKELSLDPHRLEDLIHSKASLIPHAPFIIKENLSESEYFRLRLLEKDWQGLHAEIRFERFYPQKKIASDVIGYLGPISQKEYNSIAEEILTLQNLIDQDNEEELLKNSFSSLDEAISRLHFLKEKAYSLNDLFGKTGLEGFFEESFRGFHGKKILSVDTNGIFQKELPESSSPLSGKNLITTLSMELQEFAEELLSEDEKYREGKVFAYDAQKKESCIQKQPWIKGGAIVALDPNNGEILALASYPRFDPNAFLPSNKNTPLRKKRQKEALHFLEHPSYIENIWNGNEPLSRELYSFQKKEFYEEKKLLTLNLYLDLLLPKDHESRNAFLSSIRSIEDAITLQETTENLLYLSQTKNAPLLFDVLFPNEDGNVLFSKASTIEKEEIGHLLQLHSQEIYPLKKKLLFYLSSIPHNGDKLLLIDLCRVFVHSPSFSDEIIQKLGKTSLSDYWSFSKSVLQEEENLKNLVYPFFLGSTFKEWKETKQKIFLSEKRKKETEQKRFARPYIDYLDEQEKQLFHDFWTKNRLFCLTALIKKEIPPDVPTEFLPYFSFCLKQNTSQDLLQKTLHPLSLESTLAFLKTVRSLQEMDRPLFSTYPRFIKGKLEKHLATAFYPSRGFGYGRSFAFRQATPLGSIFKLVTTYSVLQHRFLSKESLNPFSMIDKYSFEPKGEIVGFSLDGKPYFRLYKGGRLPKSSHNMGHIDLLSALEQSSNPYFSILAADYLKSPSDLIEAAQNFRFGQKTGVDLIGEFKGNLPKDVLENRTGLYSLSIGQHTLVVTPLQTAMMLASIANGGHVLKPKILLHSHSEEKTIFMPKEVRHTLLEGMKRVVSGVKGNARGEVIRKLHGNPQQLQEYKNLEKEFFGKTSTAEILYIPDLLPSEKGKKFKHIWFGAISFKEAGSFDHPELVVVVFLRFGDSGKEAAPLAAKIIQKYREILKKHS